MAVEQNYAVVDAPAKTAGKVVVTPSIQPVRGKAEVEFVGRGRVKCSPGVSVVAATLEILLPKLAQENDVVHWTSYDA